MLSLSLIVAIVGLLIYALASGKVTEIGRILFAVGGLVSLAHYDGWLPLLVAIAGLLIYALATSGIRSEPPAIPPAIRTNASGKIAEIGRILFAVGALVFVAHHDGRVGTVLHQLHAAL